MTRRTLVIGIDTGGTYTDAVLYDRRSDDVLRSAKTRTLHDDLPACIDRAIEGIDAPPDALAAIHLSTTLATNAAVEGRLRPAELVLIGYDENWSGLRAVEAADLGARRISFVRGGHDYYGAEQAPLDEAALRAALQEMHDVEAVAVSAVYGVRNPAHERRAAAIVKETTGLPVVCGHELSADLNAIRRATTAAVNAGLIPLVADLLKSLRAVTERRGLAQVPLFVLKGDGALVRFDSPSLRPVETLLSGPAASIVGAERLARGDKAASARGYVADIGGTTTDIARTEGGRVSLSPVGAHVGRFRTMVRAAEIRTVALGGDSAVRVDTAGGIRIGPERFEPLCTLPEAIPAGFCGPPCGRGDMPFFVRRTAREASFTELEMRRLLERIGTTPLAWAEIAADYRSPQVPTALLHELWKRGLVSFYGFTPTDALVALGRLTADAPHAADAARQGAELLAAVAGMKHARDFCIATTEQTARLFAAAIAADALARNGIPTDARAPLDDPLLAAVLGCDGDAHADLSLSMRLHGPVVTIGAPAAAYAHHIPARLGTQCVAPADGAVAGAVGAAVSTVWLKWQVEINPTPEKTAHRAHVPGCVRDFDDLEAAVRFATQETAERLRGEAKEAGIRDPQVRSTRAEKRVDLTAGGATNDEKTLYLGTTLYFEVYEAQGGEDG